MNRWESLKPAVNKPVLILLAGLVWAGAGIMLTWMAARWLYASQGIFIPLIIVSGIILAVIKVRFVFLKLVWNNIKRISEMEKKGFILAFISWKSYFLIAFMMTLGITLRNSSFPKEYLAIIYIGVGLALVFSSFKYFLKLAEISRS